MNQLLCSALESLEVTSELLLRHLLSSAKNSQVFLIRDSLHNFQKGLKDQDLKQVSLQATTLNGMLFLYFCAIKKLLVFSFFLLPEGNLNSHICHAYFMPQILGPLLNICSSRSRGRLRNSNTANTREKPAWVPRDHLFLLLSCNSTRSCGRTHWVIF